MNRRHFQYALLGSLAGGIASDALGAGKPRKPKRVRSLPNLKLNTTGGQQMWGDVRYHRGYRVQRHALTGHHRLLDPQDQRVAWGSLDACESALAKIRDESQLPAASSTAVVSLHGLFRTRWSMARIEHYLAQTTGWQGINLCYPSTRGTVGDHAGMLRDVIDNLEGVETIHFVAHSLGNLVIRRWLNDLGEKRLKPRGMKIGRMVMLGPPNHRPALARALVPIDRHKIIAGEAGDQLNGAWKTLEPNLATPPFEFGILAGGLGNSDGFNPLIPGDDDMIVGVRETKLAGARDFRLLPVIHATMMDDPKLQQLTGRFLQHGYFETPSQRQPLT